MPLSTGDKLGPYEILAPIGAGGMGEVYKARDTRLDRLVAIKTSKTEFSERFTREAHAVAALNHPNICQLYDLGTLPGGGSYLVMEFIDGSPIAPVDSPRKLLDLAVQIADGMAAAHAAGFTHRDLKPDNILLTGPQTPHPGRVKILDFGLAKYASSLPESEATRSIAVTNPGTVMGTVPYMSPEQARGEDVDARSDQFSFGLIVYELAARKRAFARASAAEIMAAIIRDEAEPLPPSVPTPLRWVVERCLAKDPAERYDSTKDLYRELKHSREHLPESSVSGPQAASAVGHPRWRVWGIAALTALVLAAASAWLYPSEPPRMVWRGTMLGAGESYARAPRISPDATMLAYIAHEGPFAQVAVMIILTGDSAILTHSTTSGYIDVACWASDGSRIYYDRYKAANTPAGIFSVPALGGEERLVLENAASPEALPDGSLLVVRQNPGRQLQLFRFRPDSGKLQPFPLVVRGSGQIQVRSLPGGREAVALGARLQSGADSGAEAGEHVYVVNLDSATLRRLTLGPLSGSAITRIAPGRDGKTVFAITDDGTSKAVVAIPVAESGGVRSLFPLTAGSSGLESGPDGTLYLDQAGDTAKILLFTQDGGHRETLAEFPATFRDSLGILPDGRVVVDMPFGGKHRLMVLEKGKSPSSLAATGEETALPMAAVGFDQAAVLIGPEPRRTIALVNVANGSITRRISFDKGAITSLAASPDGKVIYCAAGGMVWAIPVSGGDPRKLHTGDSVAVDPNGQFLVVQLHEAPVNRLIRLPLDGGPDREIPFPANLAPSLPLLASAVSRDGRIVTPLASTSDYWPPGVTDSAGHLLQIPQDPNGYLDFRAMAWTPDGKIVALANEERSTLWKFHAQKETR